MEPIIILTAMHRHDYEQIYQTLLLDIMSSKQLTDMEQRNCHHRFMYDYK